MVSVSPFSNYNIQQQKSFANHMVLRFGTVLGYWSPRAWVLDAPFMRRNGATFRRSCHVADSTFSLFLYRVRETSDLDCVRIRLCEQLPTLFSSGERNQGGEKFLSFFPLLLTNSYLYVKLTPSPPPPQPLQRLQQCYAEAALGSITVTRVNQ